MKSFGIALSARTLIVLACWLLPRGVDAAGIAKEPNSLPAATIDFNRDIRPILSDHCYACHGPDEKQRKAKLRLDLQSEAFKLAESGAPVIIPTDTKRSGLIQRITTADEDDRMPPAKGGKPLSSQQIQTLTRWVEQGAKWQGHWAYSKPLPPELPPVKNAAWGINSIDRFILGRLEGAGLSPQPQANKQRLLRRVSLDLTGLPPTPEELAAFVKDSDPKAYDRVVERLLKSKHYGERMALFWLDLARFADTQGYHHDAHRDVHRWRDWVIDAFNQNQPFDQFTIEQLAGDLLPNATTEQKIATGFHRNEMTTSEGGAMPEEYSVKYVAGRVDVTSRVWLGTSLACAECHDHKYDPISQKDYYQFFAYFNQVPENGLDASANPVPRVQLGSDDQNRQLAQFNKEISDLEALDKSLLDEAHAARDADRDVWIKRIHEGFVAAWTSIKPQQAAASFGAQLQIDENGSVLAQGTNAPKEEYRISIKLPDGNTTGIRLDALPDDSFPGKKSGRGPKGQFLLTHVAASVRASNPVAWAEVPAPGFGIWRSLGPFPAAGSVVEAFDKKHGPEDGVDLAKQFEDGKLKWTEQPDWTGKALLEVPGSNQVSYYYREIAITNARYAEISVRYSSGMQLWVNGKRVHSRSPNAKASKLEDPFTVWLKDGTNNLLVKAVTGPDERRKDPAAGIELSLSSGRLWRHEVLLSAAAADFNGDGYNAAGVLDERNTTGWSVGSADSEAAKAHSLFLRSDHTFGFEGGAELELRLKFEAPVPGLTLGRFRVAVASADKLGDFFEFPDPIRRAFLAGDGERTAEQRLELQRHYRKTLVPEIKQWAKTLEQQKAARDKFRDAIPVSMIMEDMAKPRDTFLLVRGEFHNRGEKVAPGVPANLMPLPDGVPANRLGLAKWLVHPDHPLTARVTVNHFWQQYFGMGLVKTAEDFGSQGEAPSHLELLDYLATEFIRSGWDVKALQLQIVLSAAYRQDSVVNSETLARDPENRLLARFPRLRLEAESVRDNALAVSGLLDGRIGGLSVYPYQPPGLWEQVAFEGTRSWEQSKGADNYRRGIYTYWRRSVPYPSLGVFDAPNRETCTIKRPRTNTPLQALVLMNDPVYVEAARALGHRIMTQGGKTIRERVEFAFRLCLGRAPGNAERRLIGAAFERELKLFSKERASAGQLIHVGASKPPLDVDPSELAAWTSVGSILLNLDETVNKG